MPEGVLVAVLFGWPAVVLGLALAACGAWLRKTALPLLGALAVLPMSWYLSGTPRFGAFAWLLPVLLAAMALSIHHRRQVATWSLLAAASSFVAMLTCVAAG